MNFTREPIIETVITPREGCKLVVRNSKTQGQEDYCVDAVEVVSFGHSFFFRSLEKPKSFLVPVSDYEILELRETRMVLKSVSSERSIKIGGGREAPPRRRDQAAPEEESHPEETAERKISSADVAPASSQPPSQHPERGGDRKRDRRRRGRRGGRDRGGPDSREQHRPSHAEGAPDASGHSVAPNAEPGEGYPSEEPKAPSFISKLFPPPPTLIRATLGRYKSLDSTEEEASPDIAKTEHRKTTEEPLFEQRFEHEDEPRSPHEDEDSEE